jgi:hypothetical protein
MNEKPQVVRSPEPRVGAAREAEEGRRIAEIAREIEELGPALEGRDRLARFGTAERAEGSPAHAGQSAGAFSPMSGGVLKMGRAIEIVRDAYRRAVAEMERLTAHENGEANSVGRRAVEEKVAPEAAARRASRETAEAQARTAAQEAVERQTAEDACFEADEALHKPPEGIEADLIQERARAQDLERQLTIRENDQKLLVQERARAQQLEQQLAIRENDQKMLAQERARAQELEQQLAARQDSQKLLAQERARAQELEQQLAARQDSQKLLAQERARAQELEQQLAARQDDQKLLAQERARNQAIELQLAVRTDTTPDGDRKARVSRSDRPASVPTAPEAPDNPEAARLMAQARLLLDQGNIIAARSVLERAAESGSALALFLLAETYDRAILSAWGIVGRRSNVTKARELYAKAVAGGVHEAKYRLSVLR